MKEINLSPHGRMGPFPALKKSGAISAYCGESTPFVYKGSLMLLENLWGEGEPRAVIRP